MKQSVVCMLMAGSVPICPVCVTRGMTFDDVFVTLDCEVLTDGTFVTIDGVPYYYEDIHFEKIGGN